MAEAPFMFHEYEQQLAQLYLNYEQAVFANPCDPEQIEATFKIWRDLLFHLHPILRQDAVTNEH